jgi:hypothetical protein
LKSFIKIEDEDEGEDDEQPKLVFFIKPAKLASWRKSDEQRSW